MGAGEAEAEARAARMSDQGDAAGSREKNVLKQVHPYIFDLNNYTDFRNGTERAAILEDFMSAFSVKGQRKQFQ